MRFPALASLALLASRASAYDHGFTDSPSTAPFWWSPDTSICEGIAFYAAVTKDAPAGTVQLQEAWNSNSGDYLYTTSGGEYAGLPAGWFDGAFRELFVWGAQVEGAVPLWRSWNGNDHLYSVDYNEGPDAGYAVEGVACWVYDAPVGGAVPIYRWLKTS